MNFLKLALSENDGSPSTMRLCTVIIVSTIMIAWAGVCIKTGELQQLSYEQMGLILGVLGIKAFQRTQEEKPTTPPTP